MQALEEIKIRQKPVFTDEAIHFKLIDYYIQPEKRAVSRHFGFHPFFTTRPYNVVREYINHFTKPGDLVLDPFAGSGVTLIEALALRRKAIAFDINLNLLQKLDRDGKFFRLQKRQGLCWYLFLLGLQI